MSSATLQTTWWRYGRTATPKPIAAVPSTVFVDPDGRIAGRVIGPIDESTLRGILSDLVKEQQGSNT
ncbi:MAG: hypothetical protein H0X18_03635 [Geodermatophilaceae bacterium]|nr:hypothetical protein [Geodermatophilaceae bacterium]